MEGVHGRKRASQEGKENRPPQRSEFHPETPFYEEQFDPYFTEQVEAPRTEDSADRDALPDDDWYWREPDNYWLEEGMWPWPEPAPAKREEPRPPGETEP